MSGVSHWLLRLALYRGTQVKSDGHSQSVTITDSDLVLVGLPAALWFFQSNHEPLLRLAVFEVQQCRCVIFGEVVDAGFHNRPALVHNSPGRSLAFLIDRSFDFGRITGCRILDGTGNDPFFADGKLQEDRRLRSAGLAVLSECKDSQRHPLDVLRLDFRDTGRDGLCLFSVFVGGRDRLAFLIDRVTFVVHTGSIVIVDRLTVIEPSYHPTCDCGRGGPFPPVVGMIVPAPVPAVCSPEATTISRQMGRMTSEVVANFIPAIQTILLVLLTVIDAVSAVVDTIVQPVTAICLTVAPVVLPVTNPVTTITLPISAVVLSIPHAVTAITLPVTTVALSSVLSVTAIALSIAGPRGSILQEVAGRAASSTRSC